MSFMSKGRCPVCYEDTFEIEYEKNTKNVFATSAQCFNKSCGLFVVGRLKIMGYLEIVNEPNKA